MLTAASRRPKRPTVRSTRSRTSSSWRMSARMNSASVPSSRTRVSPASSWRPETTIRLPCCAKANAAARPLPVSAPVINTTGVLIVSAQDVTGVTGVGGFLALLQVHRQPAGVDQHLALLAWDVGAHVPGLRAREQSRTDQLGDMLAPGFLGFRRRPRFRRKLLRRMCSMHATTNSPCSSAQVGPLQNADGLYGP